MSTKEQLVVTAERLFAVHGLDGVSLRQIGVEAGNNNNSAVQYHFGSKEGLIQAIFEHRVPHLNRRRQILGAQRATDDLRSLVEVYLLPVLEEAELDDSWYMTFLVQLQGVGAGEHPFDRLSEEMKAPNREFTARVIDLLVDLPAAIRAHRISQALTIATHAASDRERARRHGSPVLPFALWAADLFDGVLGYLQAPVSAPTLDALTSAPSSINRRFALP